MWHLEFLNNTCWIILTIQLFRSCCQAKAILARIINNNLTWQKYGMVWYGMIMLLFFKLKHKDEWYILKRISGPVGHSNPPTDFNLTSRILEWSSSSIYIKRYVCASVRRCPILWRHTHRLTFVCVCVVTHTNFCLCVCRHTY